MISPCQKTCRLVGDRCAVCYRTKEEIAQWFYMNDTDRKKIMAQLERRKSYVKDGTMDCS